MIFVFCLIFRVPSYNRSSDSDEGTESSLSIAERAQPVQTSFTSVCNLGDDQKQDLQELRNHADCGKCLHVDESCSISGDSPSSLENGVVQRAPDEVEDDQTNGQTVAVCVSLVVNGDTCARTACSSLSALHSRKALSNDAVIGADNIQGDQLNSAENSAVMELQKKENFNGVTQDLISTPFFSIDSASSSVKAGDGCCLNDVEQLSGKETCRIRHGELVKGSDCLFTENRQFFTSRKRYKHVVKLDDEGSISAVLKGGVLDKVNDTAVAEPVSGAAGREYAALMDEIACLDRQEVSALELRQDILDSGDGILLGANSGLLTTDQKLDDLLLGKCGEDLDVGVPDAVDEFTKSDEVSELDCAAARDESSAADSLVTSSEDAGCRVALDSITHGIVPDRRVAEKQCSDIANEIEDLQSWIDAANSDVQTNSAGVGAGVPLSVVEQYASELRKKKLELDQLNTRVKELEECDKDVCRDERLRLVSVHSQLHGLSATVNRIASETVCISHQLLLSR